MIVIICGKPRVGKTALNTHFAELSMRQNGRFRLKRCIEETNLLNVANRNKLPLPDIPPIYLNYEAKFHIGYKKYIEPMWVNPYWLGLPNAETPTQFILPHSEVHITEGQRVWDSRESATLPDNVSGFFEKHGHFWLDIYIDVQRAKLIDLNIRALATKIIEVQKMVHLKDAYRRILSTTWICREFSNIQDYEAYSEQGKVVPFRVATYTHEGNIFECYNSRSCKNDFVPDEKQDFKLLKFKTPSEIKVLPKEVAEMYSTAKPKWFRARQNETKKVA